MPSRAVGWRKNHPPAHSNRSCSNANLDTSKGQCYTSFALRSDVFIVITKRIVAMKKVGILYHPMIEAAHTVAEGLQDFLAARGVSVWLCSAWEGEKAELG